MPSSAASAAMRRWVAREAEAISVDRQHEVLADLAPLNCRWEQRRKAESTL
jgi:hypothetical protein